MIAALFVALQLGAATPRSLVVRDAHQRVRVPIVASADGPMLRPESLADVMAVDVRRDAGDPSKFTLSVWGTELRLEAGVALVRVGDEVRPLATRAARAERPAPRAAATRLRRVSGRRAQRALGCGQRAARPVHDFVGVRQAIERQRTRGRGRPGPSALVDGERCVDASRRASIASGARSSTTSAP